MIKQFLFFLILVPIGVWAQKSNSTNQEFSSEYFLDKIESITDFNKLKGAPLSQKLTEVESIKLIWDTYSNKLFFINSYRFTYHFDFCSKFLSFRGDLSEFNSANYHENSNQRFFIANLNFYKVSNNFGIEFSSSAAYSFSGINLLFQKIKNSVYFSDSLFLLLSSQYLQELHKSSHFNIPTKFPEEIYSNQKYQVINSGNSQGFLRFIENSDSLVYYSSKTDILVLKGSPVFVPNCNGIICSDFQTPLSHVSILVRNRNIPAAAIKTILSDSIVKALANKYVNLSFTENNWSIQENSPPDNLPISTNYKKQIILSIDTGFKEIANEKFLRLKRRNCIGTKAAALGELKYLEQNSKANWSTPKGIFAIPFYFYFQHINASGAIKSIYSLDSCKSIPEKIKLLVKIRTSILNFPMDSALLAQVTELVQQNSTLGSYRFRSSSNAEDLETFSGAGLYSSRTGKLNSSKKSLQKAILEVWASTWNEKAFFEREQASIKSSTVAMAVLCHPNYKNEISNGVAITKNIYRPSYPGYIINVQVGEYPVVNPDSGSVCDQFICSDNIDILGKSGAIQVDYITRGNLNSGIPVLSQAQINQLHKALSQIKEYFYFNSSLGESLKEDYLDYGLDLEFKFINANELVFKQIRMFPN